MIGIAMQQPMREAASPHGATGDLNLMLHHQQQQQRHHEDSGVDSSKAANTDSVLYDSQIPGHEHIMGVGMPPQQVYVNPTGQGGLVGHAGMVSLQSQFQVLGFPQEEASSTEPSSSQSNANNVDEDQDGEDGEDEPVKLFVGQVPKNLNEEDIFPVFDAFGPLKDVSVIRDKHTGLHRGCAFVTYWTLADAQTAQESLHDSYTFPGARRAAQVKPAEPHAVVPENKLFIGMLSRKAGEEEVKELFEPYGEIKEIHMIRNADGTSKCAAFLRFVSREAALSAIDTLNGQVTMEGAARPLIVRFADSKQQRQQRQMRSVRRQEMMTMPPGAYPGYHPQMAPPMGLHPGAPPQNIYPMAPQHYAATAGYPNAQPLPHHAYMYPHQYGHVAPYGYPNQQQQPQQHQPRPDMRPQAARPSEGPPGANLFVYHLPHDLTDADLATAFNPFGNVISAKVYVDKYTGESKGFGFVSYDSVAAADSAIEQMNGFQIGNKRLKVQHKRVHGDASPVMQPQPSPPVV